MLRVQAAVGRHGGIVHLPFQDELLGVFTRLDVVQGLLHRLAALLVDHLGTGDILAVFRVVGDGVIHVGDATLVHQVDDELEFVQAFEVGHLGRIACLHQGLETGFHQLDAAAAQHRLLAKEIGLGLVLEGGLDDPRPAATNGGGIGERNGARMAGSVLVDGHQVRNAAPLDELAAYRVAGRLGRDHDHVQVLAGNDLVVVDGKAVGKGQGDAFLDVGLDDLTVEYGLVLVRRQHHDHVGALHRIVDGLDHEARGFRLGGRGGSGAQAHDHVHARVLEVVGMGMSLGTVTDDGDLLALDQGEITILVVTYVDAH